MKKVKKEIVQGKRKRSILTITMDGELKKWIDQESKMNKMTPTEVGRVAIKYFLEQDGCAIREAIGRLGENQAIRQLKKKRDKLREELEKVNEELRMQNTEKTRETLKSGKKEPAAEDQGASTNEKEGAKA